MEKSSVYLTAEERRHLARLAEATGRSQSALIREAIAAYQPSDEPDRRFLLEGVGQGDGSAIADVPEEDLLQGFGQ